MVKRLCLFLLILFYLGLGNSVAQDTTKTVFPLSKVLELIEIRYNVSFSYADDQIDNITIEAPDSNFSLEEAIRFLRDKTDLQFTILNDRFIAIRGRSDDGSFKIQSLEEVVITNYLTTGISKKLTNTITIEPQKFGILPGLLEPDVLQTIQALPGVLSVDELTSNINIRGGTHDENLILWDGIKMYQSGHFFGMISAFNPYLTKKIDVAKNGTSVYYGDGVSGVIDMQNSNELDQTFGAGLGINLINADGYIKIPLSKKIEMQLSARKSITDIVNSPTYDQYFERIFEDSNFNNNSGSVLSNSERFNFYDTSAKLLYDISKTDQLRVNFISIFNDLNYSETSLANSVSQESDSDLTQSSLAFGAKYSKYWNKSFRTSLQVYYSTYDLKGINLDLSNSQRLLQENEVEDLGVRFNMTRALDERLNISAGYQFNEVGVSNLEVVNLPNFRSLSKDFTRTHAIYGEAEFTSKNKTTYARIGLRTNFIEQFSLFYTEPRLAFSQKLNDSWRMEILGEFKSQSISQVIDLQQDFLGIEKRRWLQSNGEEIPLIESQQFSVGLHYNKKKLLISVEPFIKNVDGISTRSQGFQNQFQFVTASGKYQVAGIDVLVNKQFQNFSTWLSYSYSKNEYEFEDLNDAIPFPNNNDIRHSATFAGTYNYDNLKIALGVNWHSGKPVTPPLASNPNIGTLINYDEPNSESLSDYLRTDLSATYSFKMNKNIDALAGVSILNLFDRENIINRYYTVNSDDEVIPIENQSLGFTPNINFRVRF
ncbi:TonB-dependent receptor plug domain-containing protein [Winogradskyella sp. 3972H.M.0a.05]|uniref:TonB-dependent receptor plug domain-containing protein n=1 Tax=Winogradskyella sp. 3972H.M.0a.05 TaxID=2950277 RepID=UPI003395BB59